MTQVGYGPLLGVSGPPPQKPAYTLLDAVRIVGEVDDHWLNGVKVYPFPLGPARVHDGCQTGTSRSKIADGVVPLPEFGGFAVYLEEQCSASGIWGGGLSEQESQDRFVARATAGLTAIEGWAVEKEFMSGAGLGLNPHLSDGNGVFPTGNTAKSVTEAIALLENEIAPSGRRGIIHMSPALATYARSKQLLVADDRTNVLRTINGTVVVPGYGYVGVSQPSGHTAPTGSQEWIYATGPIDVRRSEVVLVPEDVARALDRSVNTISYLVERYYVVDWDTVIHSAVLADRSI